MPLAAYFALAVMLLTLLPPARYQTTASFYGAGIATETPGGSPQYAKSAALYAFMEDASIPAEQVDQIEAELEKYQCNIVFFVTMEQTTVFSAIIALAIILKPQPMLGSMNDTCSGRFLFMNWYTTNEI